MAKKGIVPTGGSGTLSKLLGTAIVIGLLILVVKDPSGAAASAKAIVGWLGSAAEGVMTFFKQVTA